MMPYPSSVELPIPFLVIGLPLEEAVQAIALHLNGNAKHDGHVIHDFCSTLLRPAAPDPQGVN
jgi:hypothetical protein